MFCLAGFFLFFIFFGFIMLVFQLVFEAVAFVWESAHRRLEEMERKARRLCYAESGKLVAATSIQTGGYHIFLSHVVSYESTVVSKGPRESV